MNNSLTKNGLTGNSGFGVVPGIHINANYAAVKGKCFVEVEENGDLTGAWKRTTVKCAKEKGWRIIKCSYCNRPAISLDHCWPYLTEATYCAHHRDWQKHLETMKP